MKFTKKNTQIKFEGEYQNDAGETYICEVSITSPDKHTVSWKKNDPDSLFISIDADMLVGLYDLYCELTNKNKNTQSSISKPRVTDHRSGSPSSLFAEGGDAASYRTGLDPSKLGEQPETPEEYNYKNEDTQESGWKKAAKERIDRMRNKNNRKGMM